MEDKDGRKRLKEIEKELKDLEKEFKKMELRPCQNDAELIAKEKDLKAHMDRILDLEKERDRYSFPLRVIEEDAGDE
jgi:septal ring factor EnvC (AmiA/AmiB activator)